MRVIIDLIIKSILLVFIGVFIYEIPFLYHELVFMIRPFESYQIVDKSNDVLDTGSSRMIKPISTEFGLVIPKIGINEIVYDDGLKHNEGVYHLPSSNKPGSRQEVVIKTFSTEKELINKRNSIFPIAHRLIPGDEILVFYNDKKHTYQVEELQYYPTEVYDQGIEIQYSQSVRIDINWPPGLYSQKLLVYATEID